MIVAVVVVVAAVEAAFLVVLAVGSFSSDPLAARIAGGLLSIIEIPFVLFTAPALVSALRGSSQAAQVLAALGLLGMWVVWLRA